MHFIPRRRSIACDYVPDPVPEKPKRERKPAAKNDPELIKAARECRDRVLEQINSTPLLCQGKYDVSRQLEAPRTNTVTVVALPSAPKQLPEAA